MKFHVYPDKGGKWRWRIVASNGQRVAVSGESFDSKSSAKRALRRLSQTIWNRPAPVNMIEEVKR